MPRTHSVVKVTTVARRPPGHGGPTVSRGGASAIAGQRLCPGNSIATDTFLHVSNAPTEEGACDNSRRVVYETIIPGETEGVSFGSLEWRAGEEIHGMTSQAQVWRPTPSHRG